MCFGTPCKYEDYMGNCSLSGNPRCPDSDEYEYDGPEDEVEPTEDEINDAANKQFNP